MHIRKSWLGLTRDYGEFYPKSVQHGIDGFITWMRSGAQRLVQALAAKACISGDPRHALCFGNVARRGDEHIEICVFGGGGKLFEFR